MRPVRQEADAQVPLRAVRYSSRKKRWAQTSNCARGVREPLPSTVRLVTWNLDFTASDKKKRLLAALSYIQQHVLDCRTTSERPEPCCIMLQEVHVSVFAEILNAEWVRRCFVVAPASVDKWPDQAVYGNVTLVSRTIPVVNVSTIAFSNSKMKRNAIFVDIKLSIPAHEDEPRLSGGIITLRVANTHLESMPEGAGARPRQLKLIATALRGRGMFGGIVAGDMNAIGPADETIVEAAGLYDAWEGDNDDEEGFTWGYQSAGRLPPGRLDKVLTTGQEGFVVDQPERIGIGETIGRDKWVSDHYGLLVDDVNINIINRVGQINKSTTFFFHAVQLPSSSFNLTTSKFMMKFSVSYLALFVASTLAQFTINTPANVVECQPTLLTWSGGTGNILPGATPNGAAVENLGQQNSTSVTWVCNIQSGTSLGLTLRDSTGLTAQSAPFTVNPGCACFS
ncbi:Endonuclease/exonuclease/phosphatase [Suillus bovinus]|uniref:Endonuclease/exonuclease/phosphatase n=1 Tax=Suillus bovinus TaxID=48563 RepID=UPI001B879EF7|nr:Endonuclease/exonuclease/phosphatase [Suillus bovinus]KAG2146188.1 Endonuclease/exonuclease/phosphatase [Suillus bovinus]